MVMDPPCFITIINKTSWLSIISSLSNRNYWNRPKGVRKILVDRQYPCILSEPMKQTFKLIKMEVKTQCDGPKNFLFQIIHLQVERLESDNLSSHCMMINLLLDGMIFGINRNQIIVKDLSKLKTEHTLINLLRNISW